jgi:hypothetical protein
MKNLLITGLLLNVLSFCIAQQRVAPGVNPQQYQPPPPQHHQQQQQQQYQQQGQYQQQPPVQQHHQQQQQQINIPQQQIPQQQIPQQHAQMQQQQVPVQHQQPPPQQNQQQQQQQQHQQHHGAQGGHGHGAHGAHQQQLLHGGNLQEEREHIAGHMEVPIDTSKMTNEELQFHYFKMHDSDNNNKLDGCELIKSLIHWHEGDQHFVMSDDEISGTLDSTLKVLDRDGDGMVDYVEYRMGETLENYYDDYPEQRNKKS